MNNMHLFHHCLTTETIWCLIYESIICVIKIRKYYSMKKNLIYFRPFLCYEKCPYHKIDLLLANLASLLNLTFKGMSWLLFYEPSQMTIKLRAILCRSIVFTLQNAMAMGQTTKQINHIS